MAPDHPGRDAWVDDSNPLKFRIIRSARPFRGAPFIYPALIIFTRPHE